MSLVLFGAALVALLLETLSRAFTMVFVLNFSIAGPNATALLVLLLVTGFVYPLGLAAWWPHSRRLLTGLVAVALAALAASLWELPLVAVVAAAGFWMAATPVAFALLARLGSWFAVAAGLGVVGRVGVRAWLDTATPYALPEGRVLLLAVGAATGALWLWALRAGALGDEREQGVPAWSAAALVGFLFVEMAFLGVPAVAAAWLGAAYSGVLAGVLAGVVLGVAVVVWGRGPWVSGAPWAVVFAVALADLLWWGVAAPAAAAAAQAGVVVLLSVAVASGTRVDVRRAGAVTGFVQVAALAFLFLHVGAGNWAFMPGPVAALTHGRAALFLALVGLLLPLAALAADASGSGGARGVERGGVARPVGVVLAIVVVVAGAAAAVMERAGAPASGPWDGAGLVVMTFNVHQYYSEGQSGRYNLEAVRDVIRESGAHVVGLQESEGARVTSGGMDGVRWLAHQLGMHYYYGPPTGAQVYGVSLLSAYPILDARWVWLPAGESVERVAVVATVDAPGGALPVIVTHFSIPQFAADRGAQAARVVELAAPFERAVVLGDFNTEPSPGDTAYATLSGNFKDAWRAAGGDAPGFTADAGDPQRRIDHVWLKGPWSVGWCETLGGARASDHLAVACRVMPAS